MRSKQLTFILLITLSFHTQAQYSDKVNAMLDLGRDSIISMGVKQLSQAGLEIKNVDLIDRIKILTNGSEVTVSFSLPVQFAPHNSCTIQSASASLVSQSCSWGPLENGAYTLPERNEFYQLAAEDLKAIETVLSDRNEVPDWFTIKIFDKSDHYEVLEEGNNHVGGYKINKSSGMAYEEWHEHLEPSELDEMMDEKLVEVLKKE